MPTWLTVILTVSALCMLECAGSQPPIPAIVRREVCVIRTEPTPGLPRFYRRANASSPTLGPARLLCGIPLAERPLADRCEDVDELAGLTGTGRVCGPGGVEPQQVCPAYGPERLRLETPEHVTPPCAGGCENRQVTLHERSGSVLRIVFYDDPECHSPADPACPGSGHACYYRVLSLTSELR